MTMQGDGTTIGLTDGGNQDRWKDCYGGCSSESLTIQQFFS
jgi:hypothetical protein